MFNRNSEEYRKYRRAVEDLKQQRQQQKQQQPTKIDNNGEKYDPTKTFEVEQEVPAKAEKMVYASIDKSDSSDSDTEYMREAKKRNLKNLRAKVRLAPGGAVSLVRKRNADSTDSEDDADSSRNCDGDSHSSSGQLSTSRGAKREAEQSPESSSSAAPKQRAKKSRWGDKVQVVVPPAITAAAAAAAAGTTVVTPTIMGAHKILPGTGATVALTAVRRTDPALLKYAIENYGSVNLAEEDWKKAEEHYKINLLYQDMVRKRQEIDRLAQAGKFKYEYDSDEDVAGGTWEHKLRVQEMEATQLWADALTKQAEGKHHIGKLHQFILLIFASFVILDKG